MIYAKILSPAGGRQDNFGIFGGISLDKSMQVTVVKHCADFRRFAPKICL